MKNNHIAMLALVFVVSGVCGWFLEGVILEDRDKETDVVEEVVLPVVSTIPVIDTTVEIIPKANGAKYALVVNAFVESNDTLSYFLYEDRECTGKYYEVNDGKFVSIPGKSDATYYLVVKNTRTGDISEILEVGGFRPKLGMDERLTEKMLEDSFNGRKSLERGWQSKMCRSIQIKADAYTLSHITQMKSKDLRDIANYMALYPHLEADVSEVEYDAEGKLQSYRLIIVDKE